MHVYALSPLDLLASIHSRPPMFPLLLLALHVLSLSLSPAPYFLLPFLECLLDSADGVITLLVLVIESLVFGIFTLIMCLDQVMITRDQNLPFVLSFYQSCSFNLSTFLSTLLSIVLVIYLPIYLFIYSSFSLSLLSLYLFIFLCIYSSFPLSLHLSLHLFCSSLCLWS